MERLADLEKALIAKYLMLEIDRIKLPSSLAPLVALALGSRAHWLLETTTSC